MSKLSNGEEVIHFIDTDYEVVDDKVSYTGQVQFTGSAKWIPVTDWSLKDTSPDEEPNVTITPIPKRPYTKCDAKARKNRIAKWRKRKKLAKRR